MAVSHSSQSEERICLEQSTDGVVYYMFHIEHGEYKRYRDTKCLLTDSQYTLNKAPENWSRKSKFSNTRGESLVNVLLLLFSVSVKNLDKICCNVLWSFVKYQYVYISGGHLYDKSSTNNNSKPLLQNITSKIYKSPIFLNSSRHISHTAAISSCSPRLVAHWS